MNMKITLGNSVGVFVGIHSPNVPAAVRSVEARVGRPC